MSPIDQGVVYSINVFLSPSSKLK